jgi:GntR family transcriptional regulator, transcriptional repressor for pyruvate dehydrogenase complex
MIPPQTKRVARRRLADEVIEQIQEWISLGQLKPGDRLPVEDALTQQLGVSRTTLREGVSVLARAGVLDVRQGDGTYVGEPLPPSEPLNRRLKRAAALDTYEVRRVIELETARLAAERRSEKDVITMRRHLAARDAARSAGDLDAFVEADVALHVSIARASGNPVLADLFGSFATALRDTIADVMRDPLTQEDTTAWHQALVRAIADRNASAAVEATRQLLEADARALRVRS